MKKLFIILAAAFLAVNVNASKGAMVLSGSLGLNINSASEYVWDNVSEKAVKETVTNTNFSIAPNFTYFVTDKIGVGGYIGLGTQLSSLEGVDASTAFGFGVFGRYYVMKTGKFGIFGQATLGFEFGKENYLIEYFPVKANETIIGLGVVPGIQYFINKKWSVELTLDNVLSFAHRRVGDAELAVGIPGFDAKIPDTSYSQTGFNLNVNPFALDFAPLQLTLNYHF